MKFEQWFDKVDAAFGRRLGVSVNDVEDFGWDDLFSQGTSPGRAVAEWLEEYGEDYGFGEE